jgi:radical SAM superfamily enzyme YgiQ (UPF0313 family)
MSWHLLVAGDLPQAETVTEACRRTTTTIFKERGRCAKDLFNGSDVPTILFVYIGNEQGAWGSIAYPRPSHYYIMPGILYCAATLRNDPWFCDRYDIQTLYFNRTVESPELIRDRIIAAGADCVGFSAYCWNVLDTWHIAREIKSAQPRTVIFCGGPEASLKDPAEAATLFETQPAIDLLVFGEAERKIADLLAALLSGKPPPERATGYALHPRHGHEPDFTKSYVEDVAAIPSIYPFNIEVPRSKHCGLAMVYETGRGCPYRCIYCQFSHRNHKPYRFPLERVRTELAWLFERGIDCIHCADAVFDLDPAHAKAVVRHCLEHNRRTTLFFYCTFNRLDEELAGLFARSQAQICVGVQSTNPVVLKTINRSLSPRLFDDIKALLGRYRVNFYIDLIFGLPHDSPHSFDRSFNEALALGPNFLMVFPLTLIKGTPLEQNAQEYGVRVRDAEAIAGLDLQCDIEYRSIALHTNFTLDDLERFDDQALALFYFHDRFRVCLEYLTQRTGDAATLYRSIGEMTKAFLRRIGRKASNTETIGGFDDEIKSIFCAHASKAGAGPIELTAFNELFRLDILRILLQASPLREKLFQPTAEMRLCVRDGIDAADIAGSAFQTVSPQKSINAAYRLQDLRSLALLREDITPCQDPVCIAAPFSRWECQMFSATAIERHALRIIPPDRPVRGAQLLHLLRREGHGESPDAIAAALNGLMERGIVAGLSGTR